MSFTEMQLSEPINKALISMGFDEPTSIQKRAVPMLLKAEGDFVGQAQTGTGKTAAFLLPLLEQLDYSSRNVEALILTPTRELAGQVHGELEKLGKFTDIRTTTVYGGVPYFKQEKALKQDRSQVVVGTPGRIMDLINKGMLKLGNCKHLIIDEADEMLNMGFLEDVQTIMASLPEGKKTWMFSATMPKEISRLVERNFKNPEFIRTEEKTLTNADIEQFYCLLEKRDFIKGLRRVIAADSEAFGIVFCETRGECKTVSEKLQDLGVSALPLHGELSQSQREYAMARFKARKVQLLICTDIAARGIDVNDLRYVFNMGLPRQDESYVHRIGRTGRAGLSGVAISFITPREKGRLKHLERMTGQGLAPYILPDIESLKSAKVANDLSKMDGLKTALMDRGEDFKTDESFAIFEEYFSELSKEDLLKLFFSNHFNKEFRMLEEALNVQKARPDRGGAAVRTGRGRRRVEGSSSRRSGSGSRSSSGGARSGGSARSRRSGYGASSEGRSGGAGRSEGRRTRS